MKLTKMTFNEDDHGLYCSNARCKPDYESDNSYDCVFSIDDRKKCFDKTGFDLRYLGKLIGCFPSLKSAINFARNYDVPEEVIEFITLQETTRNDFDDTTPKGKVYMILNTAGFDLAGEYIKVKTNGFEGYYPCKVVDLDGNILRQNY